jgi:hypothetical protein
VNERCPSRYTVGEPGLGLPPLWRPDSRACIHEAGHAGPHCDRLHNTWPNDEETA